MSQRKHTACISCRDDCDGAEKACLVVGSRSDCFSIALPLLFHCSSILPLLFHCSSIALPLLFHCSSMTIAIYRAYFTRGTIHYRHLAAMDQVGLLPLDRQLCVQKPARLKRHTAQKSPTALPFMYTNVCSVITAWERRKQTQEQEQDPQRKMPSVPGSWICEACICRVLAYRIEWSGTC
ncbi:hypothetical protein BD289DRAFT_106448 [Coniella lustricola]|uniref:Uncharacterized protein n=1 Tax=Coniella lustricola TaxID=2025994 RepID=A0A2T2ZXL9_9PEZI|nr:hypothetical protein BD289DRAFT_106448 [Coniella lustricola]